jgi:hypothetical protein
MPNVRPVVLLSGSLREDASEKIGFDTVSCFVLQPAGVAMPDSILFHGQNNGP